MKRNCTKSIFRVLDYLFSVIAVLVIGTYSLLSFAFYSPEQIAQDKALSKITDVDFPKLRLEDWVLAENGVDNCYYWIQASFEELPNDEFYTSIEKLISEGNEFWKRENDEYIFQKEKIYVKIKKHKSGIYIDMHEYLFVWE